MQTDNKEHVKQIRTALDNMKSEEEFIISFPVVTNDGEDTETVIDKSE